MPLSVCGSYLFAVNDRSNSWESSFLPSVTVDEKFHYKALAIEHRKIVESMANRGKKQRIDLAKIASCRMAESSDPMDT